MHVPLVALFCLVVFVNYSFGVDTSGLTKEVIAAAKASGKTLSEGDEWLYRDANRMAEECNADDGAGYFAKSGSLDDAVKAAAGKIADSVADVKPDAVSVSCDAMACPSGGNMVACALE